MKDMEMSGPPSAEKSKTTERGEGVGGARIRENDCSDTIRTTTSRTKEVAELNFSFRT
jgi:hypothetical protein